MLMFVYGTLRRGECRNSVMDAGQFVGKGLLRGFAMLDLGAFPGIVPSTGDGVVVGEVYEVGDALVRRLDKIEGVPHLYTRDGAVLDDGRHVEMYVLRRDAHGCPVIRSGDWFRKEAA